MLYQNITSGFACLYFWRCIWSEAACVTVAETTGLCWPARERKTKSAFSKTKWAGGSRVLDSKQWLSCLAVSQNYLWFPMNLPAEAEFQMLNQFWRDSGLLKVCLPICWVLVWKTGCSYKRNQREEEMHCEKVRVRTSILNNGKIKHKTPHISGLGPWSALEQPLSKVFYLTLAF